MLRDRCNGSLLLTDVQVQALQWHLLASEKSHLEAFHSAPLQGTSCDVSRGQFLALASQIAQCRLGHAEAGVHQLGEGIGQEETPEPVA